MLTKSFQDQFFSESMHQMFNKHVVHTRPEDLKTLLARPSFGRKRVLS